MLIVLISIPCLLKGGTEIQTLHLVQSLIDANFAVEVTCYFESDPSVVADFEKTGAKVHLLNYNRNISTFNFILKIRNHFLLISPDIVHVQYMAPGALPIIAAKLAGIKNVIATVHQPYTTAHGIPAKFLLRISAFLCKNFIVISQNAEKSWFGSASLFDETKPLKEQPKHFTIYNAIDTSAIRKLSNAVDMTTEKKILKIPQEAIIIGAVSRLRIEKGIDVLIEAFSQLVQNDAALRLLLVGDGPDANKLKQQVTEAGIENQVIFSGEANWETAMKKMALMDIVVVPSRFEGFGLTAAEAMAMGKTVIATEVFGLKEVVEHGITGFHFPKEDSIILAEELQELIPDSSLRKSFGENAQKVAWEKYDIGIFSKKTAALYKQLLGIESIV